jgi:hypothetical protein
MKRPFAIAVLAFLGLLAIILYSDIKDFLWTHPWWQSFIAALPGIALTVLAAFELRHSDEANTLRAEANEHLAEANRLRDRIAELTSQLDTDRNTYLRQITKLTAELDAERNRHLQQIATNTARPVTQADRNAETLRKHIGARVAVSEQHGEWGAHTPEIVDINPENIVTFFMPFGSSSSTAWCVKAYCGDLEINDIPQGSCALRIKVLKRYGDAVQLGQITRWADRDQPAAAHTFTKGDTAYHATFGKPGSSERRSLAVFTSKDGANSFLLEASTGETVTGDNVEISKQFMMMFVEFEAAGFNRSSAGTGASPYRLYIHSN